MQTGPFGSKLHAHDYREEGVPLLLVKHIKNGFVEEQDLPLVGEHKWSELAVYRLCKGDIVVSRVGVVGAAVYIHPRYDAWFFSGQTLRVRLPVNDHIDTRWLVQFYQSQYFQDAINNMATGSTRLSLNTKMLANFKMPLPPIGLQRKFVEIVQPVDQQIITLRSQNEKLRAARDGLLPRLMNGSIAV